MKFSSESALQAFLHAYLGGEREVTLSPACRIDLRTDQYDIEIKLVLSNSAMDKAAGQLRRYSTYSEGRKQVIAGCAPKNFNASNRRMAQSFRDAGVEVWFVDREPEFQEAYRALYHPKPKPTLPKSSPPKPVSSVSVQPSVSKSETDRLWFLCSFVGLLFFVFLGPLMIFVDRYVIDLRLSPAYEYMNETQISTPGYTTEDLVARYAPNPSSDVVFRVSRNESRVLNVIDDKGNGWVKIVVDGQSGWVYLPSMKLVDP